jgi:hypothetical protein
MTVIFSDGRHVGAWLAGSDPVPDIAVVKVIPDHLTDMRLGDSDLLQVGDFDAAIYPGDSGGARAKLPGDLIGINTAFIDASETNPGVGFAVPINVAHKVADLLIDLARLVAAARGDLRRPDSGERRLLFLPFKDDTLSLSAPANPASRDNRSRQSCLLWLRASRDDLNAVNKASPLVRAASSSRGAAGNQQGWRWHPVAHPRMRNISRATDY